MSGALRVLAGQAVLVLDEEGPPIEGGRSAVDLVGKALSIGAGLVAIPTARLAPGFLTLRTRMAGEAIQKFVTYRIRVAIVGDIAGAVAASDALRDFVRESNRGRHVWFVPDLDALAARLAAEA